MASMSFASPQPHWIQSGGPQNTCEGRRSSAADASLSSPFNFTPQEMQPRHSFPHKKIPPPLPAFSFPQAPESGPASAPITTGPQHSGGYQDRDGEQNGGENFTVLPPSTAALPNPGPGLSARGPGRRGHAHRRSAAISSVDLTAISKAFPPKPVNGSAPSTPVDTKKHPFGHEDTTNISPHSHTNKLRLKGVVFTSLRQKTAHLPFVRKHPRSDSTAAASGTITPPGDLTNRPKTAGAKYDLSNTFGGSKDDMTERPRTASASITLSTEALESLPKLPQAKPTSRHPLCNSVLSEEIPSTPQRAPSSRKQNKKQKKMRSWAGILTRKAKKRGTKRPPSRKAPTPPPMLTRTNSAMSSLYGVDFDEDNTIVIRTPTDPNAPRRSLPAALTEDTLSLDTSWKPQSFYDQARDLDMFSPVIDLDAALGPFNTPEMGPERPVSGFSAATKRMYSGGRRGEFVVAIAQRQCFNPDVFDEKEEDEFLAENNNPQQADTPTQSKSPQESVADTADPSVKHDSTSTIKYEASKNTSGLGIQIVDIADELLSSNATTPQTVDSCPSTTVAGTPCTPDWDVSGLPRSSQMDVSPKKTVEIEQSSNPSSPPVAHHEKHLSTSLDSSNTISSTPQKFQPGKTITDPACPSPDPSTTSFDPPRLGTPSSITDRQTFNSVYSGEPESECFHNSVEDVPSLTSSASTMTGTLPRLSAGFYAKGTGDRSSSFSALHRPRPSSSHTTKRSSLVSLSKLVGVASAERSKLSYEQKAPSDDADKKKKKRGNRISRLMHFWKSKEKEKQDETKP
uniref:Cell wall proline rich protein n=1 Tax=Coccidioides posadasii RMSCC 3488 TaxID=454284 RepID=A0A0J6I5V1_COCPO|nr:hypothetical protein CPAG_03114 [Coccidioides posadasii RMSCC 3488]